MDGGSKSRTGMKRNFLTLDAGDNAEVLKGLASPIRVRILKLLHAEGALNVNQISARLDLPQSTVATNVQLLEKADLVRSQTVKARKGHQKVCVAQYDEIVVRFDADAARRKDEDLVEVSMPLGLYTGVDVSPPCGLCSTDGIIGLLDIPDFFHDPNRMQAALIWFGRGHVEYKFPNNAKLANAGVNVHAMYVIGLEGDLVELAIATDDPKKAKKLLE